MHLLIKHLYLFLLSRAVNIWFAECPTNATKPIFTTLFFFFFCFATRLHRKHGEAQYHHHHLLHHSFTTTSTTPIAKQQKTAQFLHRMNTYTIFTVRAIHPTKTIYHVPPPPFPASRFYIYPSPCCVVPFLVFVVYLLSAS